MSGAAGRDLRRALLVAAVLAAATLLLYLPVRSFGLIRCDDQRYVEEDWVVRDGLSARAVRAALGSFRHGFWVPLTWLSLQADTALQGTAPAGYHLTNAVLHALNVFLLATLLWRCTGALWPAAAAAALLAAHPVHVESVAWIVERKDVLSLFFGLLCLHAYLWHARAPTARRLLATAALLAAAVAAKPMLVTLPLLMLILDFWPLNRASRGRLPPLAEKLPLLALAAAGAWLTWRGHARIDALSGLDAVPVRERAGNAAVYVAFYLGKLAWPARLGMYYFDPGQSFGALRVVAAGLVAGGASALVAALRRRWPAGACGWAWFLVALLPVLGLVRAGDQMAADRFVYLPAIGIYLAAAFGLRALARTRRAAALAVACAVVAAAALGTGTSAQLRYWRDGVAFFRHAVEVSPHSRTARVYLAGNLAWHGQPGAAEHEFRTVLASAPAFFLGWRDYGAFLHEQRRYREALEAYRRALALSPDDGEVILFAGMALFEAGELADAEAAFRRALALSPGDPERLANLGTLLAETGRYDEAERLLREALRIDPGQPLASRNLPALRARRARPGS